jgi:hypothetical protein
MDHFGKLLYANSLCYFVGIVVGMMVFVVIPTAQYNLEDTVVTSVLLAAWRPPYSLVLYSEY